MHSFALAGFYFFPGQAQRRKRNWDSSKEKKAFWCKVPITFRRRKTLTCTAEAGWSPTTCYKGGGLFLHNQKDQKLPKSVALNERAASTLLRG